MSQTHDMRDVINVVMEFLLGKSLQGVVIVQRV